MDIAMQLGVQDLLARYAHAIDDDRLEEWPDLFVEDGCYRLTTAENLALGHPLSLIVADSRAMLRDRVSALRHANIYEAQRYRHMHCATLVEAIDTRTVRAVSSFQVLRIMHGGESMSFASGRYLDRIRLTDVGMQFEERVVVCDSRAFDTLLAIPL